MNEENEIDELFNIDKTIERAFSYSRLSDFDRNGPQALIRRSKISGHGIKIGSITDDLTLPTKDFVFDDNYIVSDIEKPTASLGRLIDIILENYVEIPTKDEVLNMCKVNDLWKRSKEETVIKNFDTDQFWDYLKLHINASEKAIITTSEYEKSKNLAEILYNHSNSKHIFDNECEGLNQVKIKFKYKDLILRGIIDRVLINHKHKTVRFIDLKTGKEDSLNFMKSFLSYRYYLQEAVYVKAFRNFCKQLGLKGYKLLPFQFLYIGRSERIPLIHTVSKKWHKAAKKGFSIKHYTYRGLDQLIDDIKWHYNNNSFEIPRKIAESNGELLLDDSFIEIKK